MLGNLTCCNPTRIRFGPDAPGRPVDKVALFGSTLMPACGGYHTPKPNEARQVLAESG